MVFLSLRHYHRIDGLAELQAHLAMECARVGGVRTWAELHGFEYSSVRKMVYGYYWPSRRLCEALGWERVLQFRRVR